MNLPLPPNMAEVEQKLQPIGQPTEGMSVAATSPGCLARLTPTLRVPMPETIRGWRMGCSGVLAQEAAEPADAFALDDVVGVDPLGAGRACWRCGPPTTIVARGRYCADQLAHLLHLEQVGNDAADAHHVVLRGREAPR